MTDGQQMPPEGFRFEGLMSFASLSQDEFLERFRYPFLLQVPVELTESAELMVDESSENTQWVAPQEILSLVRSRTQKDIHQVTVHQVRLSDDPPAATIGRVDPEVADSAAVLIDNQTVSKHHAKLEALGPVWRICDLGSVNGTFINGKQLQPGVQTLIRDRDDLRVGTYQTLFLSPKTLFRLIQGTQATTE